MDTHPQQLFSLDILRAFEFSAQAHEGQKRKGGMQVPFISHPTAVAFILGRSGFSDAAIIAGVLHDVVEDTHVTLGEIKKQFGGIVASIVQGVSEDKSLPFKERKNKYIEQIRDGTPEVKAVSCADKIANLTNVVAADKTGENVFKTIWTAGPDYTIDLYTRIYDAARHNFTHPIVDEYKRVLLDFKYVAEAHRA
jgi:(p)ppGpp synthase/HD superfamily hydrolase